LASDRNCKLLPAQSDNAPEAENLARMIRDCRICAGRFAATATAHAPRPVVWFRAQARILIAGQAPGTRVHASGRPFTDQSGDRLRDWLGMTSDEFYDLTRVAIVPMAFCFPGQDRKGADLPPPALCAQTWAAPVRAALPLVRLTVLAGGAAQRWHLGQDPRHASVTATVAGWRDHAPRVFPLPHPSWRNSGWLNRNPWFAVDLLPELRAAVRAALESP
jgi:uracil-DNA glycosylase